MESGMLSNMNWFDVTAVSGTSFLLIFAAEIGDKSQLVCMALAARYRALPVLFGSVLAFVLLNTLAVVFGAAIASWLPEVLVYSVVAILFALFGAHALVTNENHPYEGTTIRSDGSILAGTFLLITVAEFGDKTQLAVVALSTASLPIAVWLGSTLALITTTGLGVWAGRTIMQRMPVTLLHRVSAVLFISLAVFAAYQAYLAG